MPRGKKKCPSCGTYTGPRAYNCPSCNYEFISRSTTPVTYSAELSVEHNTIPPKPKKKKRKTVRRRRRKTPEESNIDWRELQPGDFIRTIAGVGPYWELEDGTTKFMGYTGKFMVKSLDSNGIHAYPADKKNSGHCYIYMGDKKVGPCGIINVSHKIKILNRKPSITNIVMSRSA